jgi:long-chain acyl-CoA synthetase
MAQREYRTLSEMFLHRVEESGSRLALQYPLDPGWGELSWKQTGERVRAIACGLRSLGLDNEQRVGILSSTRVEWILADLGILCGGGATTTVYPSNTADECTYILTDSETVLLFAEDDEQVAKVLSQRDKLLNVKKVITFAGKAGHDGWVITLEELEEIGRKHDKENAGLYERTIESVKPEHLATIIYTSGTTGQPKGVELTHDTWAFEGKAIDDINLLSVDDHQYLWLPLSHSFGKVLEAAQLQIGFATTVDGRVPKLVENLGHVRPTFMAAAPRIFEKVYNKVVTGAKQGGALKYAIFRWAIGVGHEVSKLRQEGGHASGLLALKFRIGDKLVFSKLKARFGGRIRFFISGSAALSREMAEFFHAADILILEGYGLTESGAASFVNRPDSYRFGTVGLPLPGVTVKLDEEDGEVVLHGRGIMRGYHRKPEETRAVLTSDGWLRTGDIGEVDEQGRLRITDRKKDLIKTSGGKYVAPQHLEGRLKSLSPYISQVVVHGDGRNFCSALITIDEESIAGWKQERGLEGLSYAELSTHPEVVGMMQRAVDELNEALASFETIKKFALLPRDFSVEEGELTPSMKIKRKAVETKYKAVLDRFYRESLTSMSSPSSSPDGLPGT